MRTCLSCGARTADDRRRCLQCGELLPPSSPGIQADPAAQDELFDADDLLDVPRGLGGVWRDGRLLVLRKTAQLPARCVKSNVETDRTLKRALYWHHPAIFLVIFAGLLIYVIVALIVRHSATVHIGLSPEWFARRRRAIAAGWTLSLAGFGLVFAAAATESRDYAPWMVIGGLILGILIGPIFGIVRSRMVAPTRITDHHVWLKGVHPDYLAELPPLPRNIF